MICDTGYRRDSPELRHGTLAATARSRRLVIPVFFKGASKDAIHSRWSLAQGAKIATRGPLTAQHTREAYPIIFSYNTTGASVF